MPRQVVRIVWRDRHPAGAWTNPTFGIDWDVGGRPDAQCASGGADRRLAIRPNGHAAEQDEIIPCRLRRRCSDHYSSGPSAARTSREPYRSAASAGPFTFSMSISIDVESWVCLSLPCPSRAYLAWGASAPKCVCFNGSADIGGDYCEADRSAGIWLMSGRRSNSLWEIPPHSFASPESAR
jgi:hypothetical protein